MLCQLYEEGPGKMGKLGLAGLRLYFGRNYMGFVVFFQSRSLLGARSETSPPTLVGESPSPSILR